MKIRLLALGTVSLAMLGGACGGGDGGGGGSKPESAKDIAEAIESPSGTVDKKTAPSVAEAYEKAISNAPKSRAKASAEQDISSYVCTEGGSAKAEVEGDMTSGTYSAVYEDCCVSQGCCMNGESTTFYEQAGSEVSFSYCGTFDIDYECQEQSFAISQSYCYGPDGVTYVIEVEGETFAVSGSYSSSSGGTLTIHGENGSFMCTYAADGSGSCTGDGEFEF